jgi:hypothetical protein
MEKADVVDIVRKYVGDEVAEYLSNNISEYDEKAERAKMEFNSDFESLEFQNEEYHDTILEAHNSVEQLITKLESKSRWDKEKVISTLIDIKDNLWNMV